MTDEFGWPKAPHTLRLRKVKYEPCCDVSYCDHREYHNTTTYEVTCDTCKYKRKFKSNHYHALHIEATFLEQEQLEHRFSVLFKQK